MTKNENYNSQLQKRCIQSSKSLKWIVAQIPERVALTEEDKMLQVIRKYCDDAANNIIEAVTHIICKPESCVYAGKHCKDCVRYDKCIERHDSDAIVNAEITNRMKCFRSADYYQRCKFLIDYIGSKYYRICPKCNVHHNNTCKMCAWSSCMSNSGCSVYGFWSDGQYCGENNHVVEKELTWNEIPSIAREFGAFVFLNKDEAINALQKLRAAYPNSK